MGYENLPKSAINSVATIVAGLPAPKAKKKKKKKAEPEPEDPAEAGADGDGAGKKKKKKKKKKAKAAPHPEFPPLLRGPPMTCKEAQNATVGWSANHIIANKVSSGVLATADYKKKTDTFSKMNPHTKSAGVLPQAHYFGKDIAEGKDPYDRRVVP
jgi:hypothetical protein